MPIVQYYPRRIAKGCLIREMACTDTVENDVLRGALNRHRDYCIPPSGPEDDLLLKPSPTQKPKIVLEAF